MSESKEKDYNMQKNVKKLKLETSPSSQIKMYEEILKQIQALGEICPKDCTLSPRERHFLPRPAKERWAFVEHGIQYAKEYTHLIPMNTNAEKIEEDFESYHLLMSIEQALTGISQVLADAKIKIGSDLLVVSSNVYKQAQIAEKQKVANMSAVVSTLKKYSKSAKKPNKLVDVFPTDGLRSDGFRLEEFR